jgi:hypothetical protein
MRRQSFSNVPAPSLAEIRLISGIGRPPRLLRDGSNDDFQWGQQLMCDDHKIYVMAGAAGTAVARRINAVARLTLPIDG